MTKAAIGGTVGKAQDLDGEWVFLFDRGAPTLYADLVTEMHERRGVVHVSFAAVSINGDGIPKGTLVVRLRMPKEVARQFCEDLQGLEG
ncbi:hypothetical protein SJ05684_c10280 [Sinorhizobium sojae CCBAU 05684]|uniref:Uncharacterized protein n=1 Tax=Sinorhizobium sojae CCBAU 05684 TaxID=716928 RepID=A0A249P9E6_9HYPH|nr:hypothetical protein [Sinorhizobium sojae]ASY62486.1 hypothetical protein SJ05684_c10280 [Sinorhizobium sojae CCBAU 05684]